MELEPAWVDPRIGSGDLYDYLIGMGVPAQVKQLDFGDVAWTGQGPYERPVPVGVEVKTVEDVLSCIVSKRFAGHQLPGLLETYERRYLLVQGVWTTDSKGSLLIQKPGRGGLAPADVAERTWKFSQLVGWLHTMEMAGMQVAYARDRVGVAGTIAVWWHWWHEPWRAHTSHQAVYLPELRSDPLTAYTATRKMKVASILADGVGFERAQAASSHFASIHAMVNAEPAEWMQVAGIGSILANRIVDEIRRSE